MIPEKQRIAIARHVGWTCCGHFIGMTPWGLHPSRKITDYTADQIMEQMVPLDPLPDYLNDLNAMHEAEEVLNFDQMDDYDVQLARITMRRFRANARQRAEAFLRTLNLWEE